MIDGNATESPTPTKCNKLQVFLGWCGTQSRDVATELRGLLPAILPGVEAWLSSEDINKGAAWFRQLCNVVSERSFGIFCMTPYNLKDNAWMLWEAGAIAKAVSGKEGRVVCYCVGVSPTDLPGPLRQFQGTVAGHEDTLRLLRSMNDLLEEPTPTECLDRRFKSMWPDLEALLANLQPDNEVEAAKSSKEPHVESKLEDMHRAILRIESTVVERQSPDLPPYCTPKALTRLARFFDFVWPEYVGKASELLQFLPNDVLQTFERMVRDDLGKCPDNKRLNQWHRAAQEAKQWRSENPSVIIDSLGNWWQGGNML